MSSAPATFAVGGLHLPIRATSLAVLVLQNSALFLFMRLSRTNSDEKYDPATAVILAELIKLITSLVIIYHQENSLKGFREKLFDGIIAKPATTLKLLVPSALYTLQANLTFLAVSYIDAATFQVTYQLKILTTAIFAVALLGKRLSVHQWLSLVLLMAGVALIQYPDENSAKGDFSDNEKMLGLFMVLASCLSSGFAGIYFEKVLKGKTSNIWVLNVQLGAIGCVVGSLGLALQDNDGVRRGFFFGYTSITWAVILLQAIGGLIVAIVVKYADNILKGFATSISIILSCIVSVFFFDFILTGRFVIGTGFVCAASYIYGVYGLSSSVLPAKAESVKSEEVPPPVEIENGGQ